jgi:tetratricopeptide (TPR) repeat protein
LIDRSRLRAYMSLIRELLRCPSGDELALLQTNLELVDTNLIQLMEQVATRATSKGAVTTSDFLRDLAGQLKEILSPEEIEYSQDGEIFSAHMELIEALLNSPSGAETEILRANQELIDAGFILSLQRFAKMLTEIGEDPAAEFLQSIAEPLTQALSGDSTVTIPRDYLDLLGDILRAVASNSDNVQAVYLLLEANLDKLDVGFAQALEDWATSTLVVVKPGIALRIAADIVKFATFIQDFSYGEKTNNLEIAIAGYEVSLRTYRRDKFPQQWAEVQNLLGNVYLKRIIGEKATNIEVAIECHKAALEIFQRDRFPQEWGATQYYLGTAYQNRVYGNKAENSQISFDYFQAASEISQEEENNPE